VRVHDFDLWQEPYVTLRLPMLFTCGWIPSSAPKNREIIRIGAPTAGLIGEIKNVR
jgi:hypothetical protein